MTGVTSLACKGLRKSSWRDNGVTGVTKSYLSPYVSSGVSLLVILVEVQLALVLESESGEDSEALVVVVASLLGVHLVHSRLEIL